MPSPFVIEVTLEHGQLHEHLADEADRQTMIDRLQDILLGTGNPPASREVREGVVQILIDQLRTNNAHEPLIIRSGTEGNDVQEEIVWQSKIVKVDDDKRQRQDVAIQVKVAHYRDTERTRPTGHPANPFQFDDNITGTRVASLGQRQGAQTKAQKFYKFTITAENPLTGLPSLQLDPCIICER